METVAAEVSKIKLIKIIVIFPLLPLHLSAFHTQFIWHCVLSCGWLKGT